MNTCRRPNRLPALRVEVLEARLAPHVGSSPFDPPPQTDNDYLHDTGGGLDSVTGQGTIRIDISPGRYIGDKTKLLALGLVPPSVTLRMPAYDVDVNGGSSFSPAERDEVYFVGADGQRKPLGTLTGDDNIWQMNTFTIQTAWMDFGQLSRGGTDEIGTYTSGTNYLEIDVDTLGGGWVTSIDWVSYQLTAPNPVMFVHGILSGPDTWGTDASPGPFMAQLDAAGIPYFRADVGPFDSIANNSAKLENYYQQMRTGWANDPNQPFRLDMITHSHGGLDARDWVENRDRVDQLFQLGTPNAGSPAADLYQEILTRGLPRLGSWLGSLLTGNPVGSVLGTVGGVLAGQLINYVAPTGYELTTGFMREYNASHGYNPQVDYFAYAGDYTPTRLLFLGDPNDMVVPVESVRSFAPATHYTLSGSFFDANHLGMTQSFMLANGAGPGVPGIVQQLLSPAPNRVHRLRAASAPVQGPPPGGGLIDPGETITHTFPIGDTSGETTFELLTGGDVVAVELTTPTGAVLTASSAEYVSLVENQMVRKGFVLPAGAAVGTYTVRVTGGALPAPATSALYLLTATESGSPVFLSATAGEVTAGNAVRVRADFTQGGAPLAGAAVVALVRLNETDPPLSVTLTAAPDGSYQGDIPGLPVGVHSVLVTATTGGANPSVRQASAIAVVADNGSSLTGTATVSTTDPNGNGLFDELLFEVGVDAAAAGRYRLTGTLTAADGTPISTVTIDAELTAGANSPALRFDGRTVYAAGLAGPFQLRNVSLSQYVDGLPVTVATTAGPVAQTAFTDFDDFEHDRIRLTGTGTDEASDVRGSGYPDTLTVTLGVRVEVAGVYQWSGTLVDPTGTTVATVGASGELPAGDGTIAFAFPTGGILASRRNGPYRVANVVVIGPAGAILTDSTYTTEAYGAALFGPSTLTSVMVVSGNAGASLFAPNTSGEYPASPVQLPDAFGGAPTVRTGVGDVDGDGTDDVVLVTGAGVPLRAAVVSGKDNTTLLVQPFDPFGGDFTGGGFVTVGDLDGDGKAEFVITPDQGGGPRVSVFSLSGGAQTLRANFFGIDDPNFRGGARAALGDVNGDGTPDLAVSAGFLGGPRTALFNGTTLLGTPTRLIADFFAFPGADAETLRNGVFVAAGDVDGDGFAELVFGGGPGGAPRVFILGGAQLAAGDVAGAQASPVANFFVAGNADDRGGVRLAVKDADGDSKADVVAGSGEGSPSKVRVYLGKNFTGAGEPSKSQDLDPFGTTLAGGVFVG